MNEIQKEASLPAGPLLGIDYGTVRVGLAICDRDQKIAVPYMVLERQRKEDEAKFYQELRNKERLAGLVLGLPVHMSGGESKKSKEARRYGEWLKQITGLPVAYCDERYTSAFAWEELKAGGLKASQRKKQLDKVAAQVMLQAYLEGQRNTSAITGVELPVQSTTHSGDEP